MIKTKQKIIQEAWGGLWDSVKEYSDQNGYVDFPENIHAQAIFWNHGDYDYFQTEDRLGYNGESVGVQKFRPRDLAGIEANNGWTRIESEEDLPSDIKYTIFNVVKNGEVTTAEWWGGDPERIKHWVDRYTHYQPISKPKTPLY